MHSIVSLGWPFVVVVGFRGLGGICLYTYHEGDKVHGEIQRLVLPPVVEEDDIGIVLRHQCLAWPGRQTVQARIPEKAHISSSTGPHHPPRPQGRRRGKLRHITLSLVFL